MRPGGTLSATLQPYALGENMSPLARIVAGLVAGLLTVFLIDRFVWPGTLMPGAIGVIVAMIVLAPLGRRDADS